MSQYLPGMHNPSTESEREKKTPILIFENPDSNSGTQGWQGVLYKKKQWLH